LPSKHLGVLTSGVTIKFASSPVCMHCHMLSSVSSGVFILSAESDLGGMGGLSDGWYFLGKGGLLVFMIADPLVSLEMGSVL
jgi:hypothetical protein